MDNNDIDDNDIAKRIGLYEEFLRFEWSKIYSSLGDNYSILEYREAIKSYYKRFYILETRSISIFDEARELIRWIDTNNKGVLPDDLQILFNEWLLKEKL